jgi:hypothetical protein
MAFIVDDSMVEVWISGFFFLGLLIRVQTINSEGKAAPKQEKVKRARIGSEDYCIACREGGEVVLCDHCPRGMYLRNPNAVETEAIFL